MLPVRRYPCDNIGYFLRRHGPARDIVSPIRLSKIRPSDDHRCPERLVADQSQIIWIHNRSAFWLAAAVRIVALRAIGLVNNQTATHIDRFGIFISSVGWQSHCVELIGARPARPYPLDDHLDLLVGKNTPLLLNKGRHSCVGHPLRDHLPQRVVIHQSKIKRIVERARRAKTPIGAVTTRAVLRVELIKVYDFRGTFPARRFVWFSG